MMIKYDSQQIMQIIGEYVERNEKFPLGAHVEVKLIFNVDTKTFSAEVKEVKK